MNLQEVVQRIFLIGDAGEPAANRTEPVLAALTHHASQLPERSVIMFLGDNIYPTGMPEQSDKERRLEAERRLNEQVKVVEKSGARGIFIPGNHDWSYKWWKRRANGWKNIKRQGEFLAAKNNPAVQLLPRGGCPGPEVYDVGERLRVVILDTQWWLQKGPKPVHPASNCAADSKDKVIDSLTSVLRDAGSRYVLVAGHHPLDSHGQHSGFFDWKDHLFPLRNLKSWLWIPLPVFGTIHAIVRNFGVSNQALSGPANVDMRKRIENVLSEYPPLAFVAGHEHALEILRGSGDYLIVISGHGTSAHVSTVTDGPNTLFAHLHPGFVQIEILRDGRVRLGVIEPIDDQGGREVFSMWLKGR